MPGIYGLASPGGFSQLDDMFASIRTGMNNWQGLLQQQYIDNSMGCAVGQISLGIIIKINRALADSGGLCDLADRGGLKTVLGKNLERCQGNRLFALGLVDNLR